MNVEFTDCGDKLYTGFTEMEEEFADLVEERSQFKISYVAGRLVNEKVVRLVNGFPSTKREIDTFDETQVRCI